MKKKSHYLSDGSQSGHAASGAWRTPLAALHPARLLRPFLFLLCLGWANYAVTNNNGTSSPTHMDNTLADGDKIKVEMTSNDACASPALATSDEITMTVTTPITNGPTCDTYTNKTTADGLGSNFARGVHAVGTTVYAATISGLSISTNGGSSFTNYTTANGLGGNFVNGVYAVGNTIYAATGSGLSISTNGGLNFTNYTTANGLSGGDNFVNGVYAVGNTIYAATGSGLSISTNGGLNFTNYTTTNGLGNNLVYGVYAVGNTVYAATPGGLGISTDGGSSFTNKTTADGLGSSSVRGVYAVGTTVYAATTSGLSISTDGGNTFTNYTTAAGLGNNFLRGVYAAGTTVYAGTDGGGLSISTDGGSSFTNITAPAIGASSNVYSVYATESTVYVATDGGVSFCSASTTCTPSVSITADPGNVITPGASVTFTATALNAGSIPAYSWAKNGETVGDDEDTYTDDDWQDGDVISCSVTSDDPCTFNEVAMSNEIVMIVASPCTSSIRYVKPVATGNGSGEDWDNASSDLQAMIDIDCATQVWVAAGTYKPAAYPTGCTNCSTPRDYAFVLRSGVKVYGGFAGTETALTQRTAGNETILSGDIDNDNTLNAGNTYHVVLSTNDNDQTLLDGCTVTGGNANGSGTVSIDGLDIYRYDAGGLVAKNSHTLFTNNKFVNNLGYYGGGAYVDGGSARFENCRFEDNLGDGGYGVGLYTDDAEVLIDSCHFENNQDEDAYGGGCYIEDGSGIVKNSTFVNNYAYYGGGLYMEDASMTVENCLFDSNAANYYGGGMYYDGDEGIVKNCTFVNNEVEDGYGGGLYTGDTGLLLEDCLFDGNSAEEGGGLYGYYPPDETNRCIFKHNTAFYGSAVYTNDDGIFKNCLFHENTASSDDEYGGAAFYADGYTIYLENCTFANNQNTDGTCGGVASYENEMEIVNCIFWGNTHADGNPNTAQIFNYDGESNITISYSTIQDGMPDDITDGGNNISTDPLFTDAANGDFTLQGCSPAINAGNNSGVSATDLAGNTRIQNGTVDMGAYESTPSDGFITEIAVSNISNPDCNTTTCTDDDTFTADITVTYLSKPAGGLLVLSGPTILDGSGILEVAVSQIGATSYTFVGVTLQADGQDIPLAAVFEQGCQLTDLAVDVAPTCTDNDCIITNISLANAGACNDNGTTADTDDYFTADVTVTFAYAPEFETLVLTDAGGAVLATKEVSDGLFCTTTWTFEDVQLPANGQDVVLTAEFYSTNRHAGQSAFTSNEGCTYTSGVLMTAPQPCSCVPTSAFTVCPDDLPINVAPGACTAIAMYSATANGEPAPEYTYTFSGATTGSGDGTGSNSIFEVGTTTVSITATNACGTAVCAFDVTVTDNIAPTITCPTTQTLTLGANCTASLPNYTSLSTTGDNCSVQGVTQSPAAGTTVSGAGNMTVTLTVTDVNGLTKTCDFTVTKVDNTPPTVVCSNGTVNFNGEMSIALDENALVSASDNCGIQGIALSPNSISSEQVGQIVPVTVTVTDVNSNVSTCMANVTVSGLPSGWSQQPGGVGCASGNNIAYNTGTGVWTATSTNCYYASPFSADATAFAQRTLCGDGSITARVMSISGSALGWAGIVMRESNMPGAKKAQLMTNLSSLHRREFRTATNGAAQLQQSAANGRHWLRITRTGNQFAMYVSLNGTTWYFVGAQNIVMGSCIEMGLVATNYTANSTVTATFSGVSYSDNNPIVETSTGQSAQSLDAPYSFEVYPNPTGGDLNVDLTEYMGCSVRIELYSIEGKVLKFKEVEEVQTLLEHLDMSDLQNGMYLVKVRSVVRDGISREQPDVTRRVILQREK